MGWVSSLVISLVLIVLTELLRPKPEVEEQRPRSIDDFQVPTATPGRPVPLIFGRTLLRAPNVIYYGDLEARRLSRRIQTGLWSSERVTTGYQYYLSLQMGISRGPGVQVHTIYVGENPIEFVPDGGMAGDPLTDNTSVVIDQPTFFGGSGEGGRGGIVAENMRFYDGTEDQPVDPYLATVQNIAGATPRYQGTSYLVVERGYFGDSTSIDPWWFEASRLNDGPAVDDEIDRQMNPINAAWELFTNQEWGFGREQSELNIANFIEAGNQLAGEGNWFNFLLGTDLEASTLLEEIERQIDGIFFKNPFTKLIECKLIRGESGPFTEIDEVIEVRAYSRGAWEDTTNFVRVRFNNKNKQYQQDFSPASDIANAQLQGGGSPAKLVRVIGNTDYPGVTDPVLANLIAFRELRTLSYPILSAEIVVDRQFFRLLPGDIFLWTNTARGLNQLPMRVQSVDYGELDSGRILFKVTQDLFDFGDAGFRPPDNTSAETPTIALLPDLQVALFELPEYLSGPQTQVIVLRTPANLNGDDADIFATFFNIASPAQFRDTDLNQSAIQGATLDVELDADDQVYDGEIVVTAVGSSDFSEIDDVTNADPVVWQAGAVTVFVNDEIMYAKAVTNISGTSYRITGLIRGATGTKRATHAANSEIYVLNRSDGTEVFTEGLTPGRDWYVRAQPIGLGVSPALGDIDIESINIRGNGVVPPDVSALRLTGAGAIHDGDFQDSADVTFTWTYFTPRTSAVGAGLYGAGTVIAEPGPEGQFLIEILDGGMVVRTVEQFGSSYTYTAANRSADFTGEPSSFTVRVRQQRDGYLSENVERVFNKGN